jgi:RND family efflux transporter MFP subunit
MKSAAVLAWLGLTLFGSAGGSAPPPPDIRPVRTIIANPQAEGEPISITGHVRARTEESLAFRVDGRMITRRVGIGQFVRPGDLIAEIDPQPLLDAVNTTQARHVAAQATLDEAAKNLERKQTLVQQGWATQVQFDAAERTYLSAKAEVDATAAQLHGAEEIFGYTRLRADAAGVVIATGAEAGEVVRAGQMIVRIAQSNGVDAVFDVPAALIRDVPPNPEISIALSDDPRVRTFGLVREVSPQADPVTRSYQVKVELTEPPAEMRLGATVTGKTHMRATGGIELPATALTLADDRPAVWVVDPRSYEVSLRPIQLLRQDSERIVVADGLNGGELVVTAGVHALRPDLKVRLLEEPR